MTDTISGNLLTTAMGIMPHTDVERALDMAQSLDVPFWPQLPHYSYYEDMYVQSSEHFPGIILDMEKRSLRFSMDKFLEELEEMLLRFDEPGLQYLFSAMSGYSDGSAKGALEKFFAQVERPRGVHLCGNPDWDFLLNLDLDVLSLDVYTNGEVFSCYATSIRKFLDRGGLIVWGIVPTGFDAFEQEEIPSLIRRLEGIWSALWSKGIDREQLISRSMLSPATCSLINPDKERTVERAFAAVNRMAEELRDAYL